MRRLFLPFSAALIIAAATPTTASAQQAVDFYLGGFIPAPLDARGVDDVLFQNTNYLAFHMGDFDGFTFGGDYLINLTHNFQAGLGIGYYQETAHSVYLNLVNSNGLEIPQDLKMRIVPFWATVRYLPFGDAPIKPYIGGGVAVYYWRYSETGQFVDNSNNIFTGNFVGSGGAVGPAVLGGIRFPAGFMDFGFEVRWQGGEATLPPSQTFAGPKLDLGGFNYLFTTTVKF